MGTAIVVQSKQVALIEDALIQAQDQLVQTLPAQMRAEADRFRSVLLDLLMEPDSMLAKCDPGSIVKAALEAAALGLFFTKHLGHAYLVPYDGKAEMQIGWRGLVHLAKGADSTISDIKPELVYPGEQFQEVLGLDPQLVHIPKDGERGVVSISGGILSGFTHAYAVARYRTDAHRPPTYVLMSLGDIQKCKNASKTSSPKTPWFTWTKAMVEKCPVRKLCLRLGLVPSITAAIARDEYREFGVENSQQASLPVMQMPRRLSQASAPVPPEPPKEPDYSLDIPPLCPKCKSETELKPAGVGKGGSYAARWRCKVCPKNTTGCAVDAAKWHEKEVARLEALAPPQAQAQREPG